jgi:hypothetical protein
MAEDNRTEYKLILGYMCQLLWHKGVDYKGTEVHHSEEVKEKRKAMGLLQTFPGVPLFASGSLTGEQLSHIENTFCDFFAFFTIERGDDKQKNNRRYLLALLEQLIHNSRAHELIGVENANKMLELEVRKKNWIR